MRTISLMADATFSSGRVTRSARMGSLSLRLRSSVEQLEARAIAPLQALDHDDQRLPAGEGREQVAHAVEDQLAAVADVLFVTGCHLLPGDELAPGKSRGADRARRWRAGREGRRFDARRRASD